MRITFLLLFLVSTGTSAAQQAQSFDYWQHNRSMIQRGVQAVLTCNGLFTSERSLHQVFDQELKYVSSPIGTADGGDYVIDWEKKAVAIGSDGNVPTMRAAYRTGLGCIVLPPDQSFSDIDSLPVLATPPVPGDPLKIPWPDGDDTGEIEIPSDLNADSLQAASDWAFDRSQMAHPSEVTLSLLIVYRGNIIHERYAPGVNYLTKTRTWSTAKSIAVTLIGMMVDQGKMNLDSSLGLEWLPGSPSPETDPRHEISLRHVLNMSSGLYPIDNRGLEYATGSGLSYWAGASSVHGALSKAQIREPGTSWDYENYDTILAMAALKKAIGNDQEYLEYPRIALFDKIGMRNTVPGVDRFGDFIFSSQVYTNARDLARLGLLYLNNGVWKGERLLSEKWIEFVRTPAPASASRGNFYGGQWWLVPDGRTDIPGTAYWMSGNRGQFTIVVPSHDLVIVRRGLDYSPQRFDPRILLREVVKAFPATGGTN